MRGPLECPNCGHDPTGDDEKFISGGGWVFDHEVVDGVYVEIFRCPVCDTAVSRTEKSMSGSHEVRGP